MHRRQARSEPIVIHFEAIALAMYFIRDAAGGMLRYYSSIYGVEALWFLPDIAAIGCIVLFVNRCIIRNQSIFAFIVLVQILLSLVIGYVFLGTFNAALSSFKMIAPIFVGFCFCDVSLGSYKRLLSILALTFYLSIGGVYLSAYVPLPWVGFTYESFGAARTAGRLWWTMSEQRLAGFAADNTMAGFFILITFVLTSIRSSTIWCLVFGSLSMYAIRLTTSKTTMVVLGIYLLCLLIVRVLPERMRLPAVRHLALWSFAAIFIPFILILFLSGTNLTTTSSFLFSMQDRINNSWQLPFSYLWQLMPIGLVTGCGLGCFNYPMQLFSPWASLWVPVDNFYIGTYLMFGLPFVGFMWMVFRAAFLITDVYKLCTIFTMNLFTITVLSYGPATGLLMIALGFSQVFSLDASRQMHRNSAGRDRVPVLPASPPLAAAE
jgi:hypothetical protein